MLVKDLPDGPRAEAGRRRLVSRDSNVAPEGSGESLMGGHPWFYFVDYQPNVDEALQALRRREFEAGRYNPVTLFPAFPVTSDSHSPGAKHSSIVQAQRAADDDGTRSILDMERTGQTPGYGVVANLPLQRLKELFGTERPSQGMIEENMDFFEDIERGQGIYIIVYENDRPSQIFFAGYSYD